MKNYFLVITFLIFSSSFVYAATCPKGCLDIAEINSLRDTNVQNYKDLDKELARFIRDEITKEIARGHLEIEEASRVVLINIEDLKERYLLLEKELLFNEVIINELNSILTDMIGENANLKTNKRSFEHLKRELSK